MLPAI